MNNPLLSIPITKIANFTDIHFGKKNNSNLHNQDCVDFIDWFCEQVKKEGDISHIGFLGDWFENRSAINISTLEYSYRALKKLNALGIPLFFCVGNHDLHKRHTRDVHSVNIFNELENFIIVDEPLVVQNILWCPFLFEDEYPSLAQHNDKDFWFGHFEFKGFRLTGNNRIMEHGPDHNQFSGPKKIFSGHYHCRQFNKNCTYIGNTFPMDYSDAGEDDRGMMILDVENKDNKDVEECIKFIDWDDLPMYLKTDFSSIVDGTVEFRTKMRVKVTNDCGLAYSEVQEYREKLIEEHGLREMVIDNSIATDILTEDGEELDTESKSVDEIVLESIESMEDTTTIKSKKLMKMYENLRTKKS